MRERAEAEIDFFCPRNVWRIVCPLGPWGLSIVSPRGLQIRRTTARGYYVQAPWNALRTTQKRPTIDERRDLRDAEKGFNFGLLSGVR